VSALRSSFARAYRRFPFHLFGDAISPADVSLSY